MNLLHIDSSILGDGSVSRQLTAKVVAEARAKYAALQVAYRDLVADPINHLTGAHLAVAQGAKAASTNVQDEVESGQRDLDAFLAADVVVVGAPMYNFSVPSQLKTWIDRISVAGKTFRYTEKGPVGMAGPKKVLVVSTRGGSYSESSPAGFLDHQESYLRGLFGFLGITDVQFVRAEGLNAGDTFRSKALESAHGEIAGALA